MTLRLPIAQAVSFLSSRAAKAKASSELFTKEALPKALPKAKVLPEAKVKPAELSTPPIKTFGPSPKQQATDLKAQPAPKLVTISTTQPLGLAPINSSRDGLAAENTGERGTSVDTSKTFQEVITRIVENLKEVELVTGLQGRPIASGGKSNETEKEDITTSETKVASLERVLALRTLGSASFNSSRDGLTAENTVKEWSVPKSIKPKVRILYIGPFVYEDALQLKAQKWLSTFRAYDFEPEVVVATPPFQTDEIEWLRIRTTIGIIVPSDLSVHCK